MRRTQIYLEEDVDRRLRAVARSHRCSAAAVVRDAVKEYLLREDVECDKDPFADLIGIAGGPPDGAENHDYYLYGISKQEARERDHKRQQRSS